MLGLRQSSAERSDWLVTMQPAAADPIIVEPAKVLFLNNAINHGVLTPLGIEQAAEDG